MIRFPEDLKYSKDHVWIRLEKDGLATVGVTEVFLKFIGQPEEIEFLVNEGQSFSDGSNLARLVASKDEMEVIAPATGQVIEVNSDLGDAPEALEDDPYEENWLFRVDVGDANLDYLLPADDYEDFVAEESAELEDEGEEEEDEELDMEDEDEDDY